MLPPTPFVVDTIDDPGRSAPGGIELPTLHEIVAAGLADSIVAALNDACAELLADCLAPRAGDSQD